MKKSLAIFFLCCAASSFAKAEDTAAKSDSGKFVPGAFQQGGVIFWLDPAKSYDHGLIADIKDASTSAGTTFAWDTQAPSKTGATGNKAYSGSENTKTIINAIGDRAEAAQACVKSNNQGFSDWYLPSEFELSLMLEKQALVTKTSGENGGDAVDNAPYWSSTEFHRNSAWSVSPTSNGKHKATNKKSLKHVVRCIRAF